MLETIMTHLGTFQTSQSSRSFQRQSQRPLLSLSPTPIPHPVMLLTKLNFVP